MAVTRPGVLVAAAAIVALGAFAAALGWLLGTQAGAGWVIERARSVAGSSLALEEARGTLLSGISVERLTYRTPELRIQADDLGVDLDFLGILTGALAFERLSARRIEIEAASRDTGPALPPLSLPFRLRATSAHVAELLFVQGGARYPFTGVQLGYRGGPGGHRVQDLRADSPWGRIGLTGSVDAGASRDVAAELTLSRSSEPLAGEAHIKLGGRVERMTVQARASTAKLKIDGRGVLAPFSEQQVESLKLHARDVNLAGFDPAWPATRLTVEVDTRGSVFGRNGFALSGSVAAANTLAGPVDRGRIPVSRLSSAFSAGLDKVHLRALKAAVGDGALTGQADISREKLHFELQARAVSLRDFHSSLTRTALGGKLELTQLAPARNTLRADLAQDDMRLVLRAERKEAIVDVSELRARARGGELRASGQVRFASRPQFDAALRLTRFDPARFGDYPQGNLNGSGKISAVLGNVHSRAFSAHWTIAGSQLRNLPFETSGSAQLQGKLISAIDANARLGANRASARGAFGNEKDILAWTLDAPQLAQVDARFAGRLSAQGQASGTARQVSVSLSAQGQRLAFEGWMARELNVQARATIAPGERTLVQGAPLEVALQSAGLSIPGFQLERVELAGKGTLAQHELRLGARASPLDAQARLRGGWDATQGWSGEIVSLRQRGEYPLELAQPAALKVSRTQVSLGTFRSSLGSGHLLIREALWTPNRISSSGEFKALPAQWLLAPAKMGSKLRASLLLDGDWALASTPRLNGRVALQRAGGDISVLGEQPFDLELRTLNLAARIVDDRIIARGDARTRIGDIDLEGEIAPAPNAQRFVFNAQSPVRMDVHLQLADIRPIASAFLPEARLAGSLGAQLTGRGTLGKPVLNGSLRADGLGVELPAYGVYLRSGRLRASLDGDRLKVAEFVIEGGDGKLSAQGILPLRFAEGGAALEWHAEHLRVLNRPDMRLVASGQGTAGFDGKRISLQGALSAERGEFEIAPRTLPQLGDDVVVVGDNRLGPRARQRVPLRLNLDVALGERIAVRGRGFEGFLRGRLQLTTTAEGELRGKGRIQSADATFEAYGAKLQVDPGELFFDGPLDNPALQVTAWRRNQEVEAGVKLIGTLKSPQVSLVSEPPVAEGEKLSWLVLGRAPGEAAGASLAILQAAGGALLGRGSRSVPITRRIASAFGLDEFDVRGGGSGGLSTRVVALGKRLSDRLYLSYEQGLGAAAENLVKLDFSLTRRLSLRAETGSASGIGLFYRYAWD